MDKATINVMWLAYCHRWLGPRKMLNVQKLSTQELKAEAITLSMTWRIKARKTEVILREAVKTERNKDSLACVERGL